MVDDRRSNQLEVWIKIWQVDSDCINSLYTFEHMQDMCMDHEVLVSYPDFDTCKSEQNKTVVVDAGRIYKFPFSFNLANLLPKSRHHSSMTYSLFTLCDDCDSDDNINTAKDDKQLNLMLERSFYLRMRTINDRSFDVDNSNSTTDLNQIITKVNNQDIGQCFMKRVDDTRLILTVAPSYGEKKYNSTNDNSTEDDFQPLNRSRANTWHHTKRNAGLLCPQSLENSKHYYRTMSVGSKPLNTIETSLDELKLDYNVWTSDINDIQNECTSDSDNNLQEFPINVFIEVYDCRQEDIENVLMFDNYSNDQSVNDYIEDESSSCSSTATKSDKNKECNPFISKKNKMNFEEPDPLLIEKYLQNIRVVFNQSFVTTVFHALHLGLNVPYIDIQRAIDHCQYRLVTFEITNYIKVVCDHFKKNANSNICPTDNTTLKSHHDMINTTFSSILDRHMLKSVDNHPDYFFYDFIERYGYDDDSDGSYYTSNELSVDGNKNKYIPKILLGKPHKTNLDSYEVDEQDLFPLFVQLMCTVKTNKITSRQVVRSLPTCIIELMSQNNENESTRNMNLSDLKVSLDVYCLILPNNYYDDNDDDSEDINTFNKGNSSEQLHFPIHSSSTTLTLTKQIESFEKLFLYLSASLPTRHAQGLAAFIAEVDWCMRDEMAAGLLKDPIVTPETLNKVIEHVTNSPSSSANHQQNLVMHFVPSPGPSKYSSVSLFLQRLDQLEIILDIGNDNIDRLYTLAKSTNDTFYVVKKDMPLSTNNEAWSNNRKYSKPMLPNFWLVLKIQEDQQYQKENNSNHNTKVNTLIVNVYFHCRFTELDLEGRYSAVREAVGLNIRQAATIVNQTFLLWRLHDTRICDPLLEPINNEDLSNTDEDDNDKEEIEKIKKYFTLGQFKCPIVWSTRFSLNPRIRHSTNLLVFGGAHVLNPVLDKFSIRNRRNMFSYRESKTGSVFYLKLYECSNQPHQKFNLVDPSLQSDSEDDTISRCSSATSTTATISSSINPSNNLYASRKYSEDLNYMDNKFIQTPGVRSLGGYYPDTDSKTVEYLTLNVHGISPAGTEIRIDLVGVLQNRLNDAVLEVLTTMLYRNPACRLYPDDVRFIQPVGGDVDFTSQLSLPIETKITKYFARNLKRNAATLSLYSPKYVSRHQKFNYTYDALNTTKPVIRSYFIYNYPCFGNTGTGGIRPYSGKRGLACVLYDIYSNEDHLIDDLLYDYPIDIDLFKKRVEVTCIEDNMRSTTDHSGYVKLFVWCRGRVLIEPLQKKMTSIVTYSLWDSYVERYFCEHPIIIEEPNEAYMNPLCIQFLTKWIAFGAHLGVPLAHHSEIQCRIHMDHVLREFKTHLSWSGTFTSNKVTTLSVRYFYVPNTQYGQSTADCGCTNIISDSPDPLQLKQKQNELLLNNLIFYEWNISNTDSVICPPSAACVLIVVTVTSKKNTRQRRKRSQNQNKDIELSDSDSDNGVIVPEDEENVKSEEDKIKTLISNDQIMVPSNTSNDDVKQDSITHSKMHQKENSMNNRNKVNKLSLLAISGQSVHILSYNCYDNDDQAITVNHLSNWLELRRTAFDLSIFSMMGLKSAQKSNEVIGSRINNYSKIKNNPDLLLDYKNYVAVMGEHESHQKVNNDKSNRQNKNTQKRNCAKSTDKNMDDKKNKSLIYKKDFNDLFIEQLVKNHKLQCRTEINQKILYDMWTQVDTVVTKDTLRVFYNHSRLLHYCLTPLLFLPQWRFESAATRDHLVDANKTRNVPSPPPPQWHKRLCTQLTNAYANYIETNSLFSGFQSVHVNRSRSYCDGVALEIDNNKPTTRYYKKSVPGAAGGILVLETGVCQPFYYVKLSCVERNMIVNHLDKPQSPLTLLDESENIIRNMHLHSFTYDFHIRVLSDKLNKLLQKQKSGKKNLSILLESKISAQSSTNKAESVSNKNAIAGFLDDFLKYYTLPPLYSNCLVLAGIIKRTQISVTGIQLYEYILGNCSEDCNNMAVIKICDSALVDGDDGASLFDDNNENNNYFENQNSLGNDLSDFIIVHRMIGSDIKRRQKSEMNSYLSKLGIEANDVFTDCQFEIYGLKDATLVMTLSSVKEVSSDTSNEITLSYYVLLTNNDNNTLQKMEKTSFRGGCNIQQTLNRFHYSPSHRFELGDNLLVSASVPSNSFGNVLSFGSPTCWGSLGENNADSPINTSPESKNKSEKDFNSHHQQMIKKRSLIKFYEKKAAELVAHTVDTAANRCCTHLLWKKFAIQLDLSKSGPSNITSSELEDLIHKSGHVISLAAYDRRLRPVIEELSQNPLWFNSLHKLICNPTPFASTISLRCRIFNSNNSEQQYLVVLPKKSNIMNINVFIIIDNGVVSPGRATPTPDSLMNIVFRRNAVCSEEVFPLVESIGKAICYYIWHSVITGSVSNTTFHI